MRKLVIQITLLWSIFFASPVHAEQTAEYFITKIDGPDLTTAVMAKQLLNAYAIGITWAEWDAVKRGASPVICMPDKLALTVDQTVDILRRAMTNNRSIAEAPAGLALMESLKSTFPCK
ncbi:hypothetical protein [Sphingorhabdus contaminans]|uniref:Rap1a immunity protein domain-containing protein n=1 Tax=Sphingorhabdus contaminans TaxID=1343899 RepID=A0A553WIQ5_9SPHN|nr:hypothetical protein [Sphingorhabdus contaminans]TSB04569.1 hypothetical protein FOM92_03900 [Sphingorhabdus contaminans]